MRRLPIKLLAQLPHKPSKGCSCFCCLLQQPHHQRTSPPTDTCALLLLLVLMLQPCQYRSCRHVWLTCAWVVWMRASCWVCWQQTHPQECRAGVMTGAPFFCDAAAGVCHASSWHGGAAAASAASVVLTWAASAALLLCSAGLVLTQTCRVSNKQAERHEQQQHDAAHRQDRS